MDTAMITTTITLVDGMVEIAVPLALSVVVGLWTVGAGLLIVLLPMVVMTSSVTFALARLLSMPNQHFLLLFVLQNK